MALEPSMSDRIESFEDNQEVRLHRMECLLFASDFAHFQKLDKMLVAMVQSPPGNVVHQPESEASPTKPAVLLNNL